MSFKQTEKSLYLKHYTLHHIIDETLLSSSYRRLFVLYIKPIIKSLTRSMWIYHLLDLCGFYMYTSIFGKVKKI